MTVTLNEFIANPKLYVDLAEKSDVIVLEDGKKLAMIVNIKEKENHEKKNAFEGDEIDYVKKAAFDHMMHILETIPSIPDDTIYDPIKEQRLREKGLL